MKETAAMERMKDKLESFEKKYPDCRLEGPKDDGLRSYADLQNWLCFSLWAKDEAVAEYIYREQSGPDSLLRRMGDEPLILCAATVYGLKRGLPETVPSRETREQTLKSVVRRIPLFDRLAELSDKSRLGQSEAKGKIYYHKMCWDVLTMPEREPMADEVLLRTLQDKTDAFFRDHLAELGKSVINFSKQTAEDYVALAYPVLCAVREGNLAVAEFVTFGMAPNRDPFMAVGDFWIKSAAAAVVGVAKGDDDRYDWPTTMLGLIDFYVAYGGDDDTRWYRGDNSWYAIPGLWYAHKIDEDYVLTLEWIYTAHYNVMYRLNYYLDFDYLEQIWYKGGLNSLGEIWLKNGFPGGKKRVMRVCPPEPERDPG